MSNIFYYEYQSKITVTLLLMVILLTVFVSACSKATPACDDKNTLEAVRATGMEIVEDISFVASMGSGELSEDEKRMFKASMNVNVDNIRQKSVDEDANTYTCAADLTVRSSAGVESNPITYTSTLQNGEIQVTISGLN